MSGWFQRFVWFPKLLCDWLVSQDSWSFNVSCLAWTIHRPVPIANRSALYRKHSLRHFYVHTMIKFWRSVQDSTFGYTYMCITPNKTVLVSTAMGVRPHPRPSYYTFWECFYCCDRWSRTSRSLRFYFKSTKNGRAPSWRFPSAHFDYDARPLSHTSWFWCQTALAYTMILVPDRSRVHHDSGARPLSRTLWFWY